MVLDSVRTLSANADYDFWCVMSIQRIADNLDLHYNTVSLAMKKLEEVGLLVRRRTNPQDTACRVTNEWHQWFAQGTGDLIMALKNKNGEVTGYIPRKTMKQINKSGNPHKKCGTPTKNVVDPHKKRGGGPTKNVGNIYKDIDINKIYTLYKEKIQKNARLTDAAKKKINTRLKEFSVQEINIAIENFAADSWWMEKNSNKGMKWFFDTDDRIEQFINLKPKIIKKSKPIKKLISTL
tara:strand:+ start:20666 stop:21376 length:711 start_codon:yes stop_codon:yes gene_type:complete